MRVFLPPMRRPRHPVMRVLMALLGLAVLGVFMVFGLMALAVFIAVGGVLFLLRWWNTRHQRRNGARPGAAHRYADEQVIEGEYVIVHERRQSTHH
jgi:fatty acid desaturase